MINKEYSVVMEENEVFIIDKELNTKIIRLIQNHHEPWTVKQIYDLGYLSQLDFLHCLANLLVELNYTHRNVLN